MLAVLAPGLVLQTTYYKVIMFWCSLTRKYGFFSYFNSFLLVNFNSKFYNEIVINIFASINVNLRTCLMNDLLYTQHNNPVFPCKQYDISSSFLFLLILKSNFHITVTNISVGSLLLYHEKHQICPPYMLEISMLKAQFNCFYIAQVS